MTDIEKIKGVTWEVKLQSADLYYVGRGATPVAALQDLTDSMGVGITHAQEQVDIQARRLEKLREALTEVSDGE